MRSLLRPDEGDPGIGPVAKGAGDDVLPGARAGNWLGEDRHADVRGDQFDGVRPVAGGEVDRDDALPIQVAQLHLVEGGDEGPAGGDDHRGLPIEGDRVPVIVGGDVAEQRHLHAAVAESGEGRILGERDEFKSTPGAALLPDAFPFAGRGARHEGDHERFRHGPQASRRDTTLDGMTDLPRDDRRQQPKPPKEQLLKPATAAQKLGVFLPATPEEFRAEPISRTRLQELQADPPAWLTTLRREGPHPRGEVARRLGVSNSALVRAEVSDSMTTAEIRALLDEMPVWLVTEREKLAAAQATEAASPSGNPDPR